MTKTTYLAPSLISIIMKLLTNPIVLLLIVLAMLPPLKCSFLEPYQININQYYKMPSLNKFESYDECLGTYNEEAKFCYVKTYIKPDDNSELYNYIRNFSSMGKQHFRHDKLVRGICMNSCQNIIDKMGNNSDKYFVPEFPMDTILNFDFVNFVNVTEHRAKYNAIINKCINIELMDQYHLSGYSSIEYCTQKEISTQIDWLDISFIVLVCTLMMLVLMSTQYDKHLMILSQRESEVISYNQRDFFNTVFPKTYQKLLTAFSIRRNWHLLTADNNQNTSELRCFEGIRFWSFIRVIYGHCAWIGISLPIFNTAFVESNYHQIKAMLLINGGNVVQTFFFLGGFLNSVALLAFMENNRLTYVQVWLKGFFFRLIRFVPVLIFIVMLNATWLYRLDQGPFWDKVVYAERQACRKNWWTNILFINNYVGGDQKCMLHTWYISADFHLSALGSALVLLIVYKPKRTKLILGGSFMLSFVVAAIHSYVTKMEPILIFTPETLRNQFYVTTTIDNNFYDYHTPTHLNSGTYLIGLSLGLWYHQYKTANKKHHRKTWIQILWLFVYVCQWAFVFCGFYFYETNVELNISTALLSTFCKHFYGLVIGVTTLGVMFKYGFIISKIFNYPIYRVLGRLSFSVYMGHLSISMILLVNSKNMSEVNNTTNLVYTLASYILSYAFALFLTLNIELPASVIVKTIFNDVIIKRKSGKRIEMKIVNGNDITQSITSTTMTI